MKIAFVAPPQLAEYQNIPIAPPLPLAYIAALLEQQRHIVRIYDFALSRSLPLDTALAPVRAFRPHLIVIPSDDAQVAAQIERALANCGSLVMRISASLRDPAPAQAVIQALWSLDKQPVTQDEQTVIYEALLGLHEDLDALPFPARHLLSLEQYVLFTPAGDLQTNLLVSQKMSPHDTTPRRPAQIVAELRSIVREHGIRHFVFPSPPLTHNMEWLNSLLQHLTAAGLGIGWEASVRYEQMDAELLRRFRQAGCEVLCFEFSAGEVLLSSEERTALAEVVNQAHQLGISVRAHIDLEAPYGAIPALVDISATFGIDDVNFRVAPGKNTGLERTVSEDVTIEDVAEMARSRYRSSRSRQFFIDRFGPQLGPMLWRIGRAGLLGRTWRQYANGSEDRALVY